jgi:hypothetical protein
MPWAQKKTEWLSPHPAREGQDVVVYLCDWPDCSNEATQMIGCVKELGGGVALCARHAALRAA